jgi:DNA-binding LytR/AlgR family response regulator
LTVGRVPNRRSAAQDRLDANRFAQVHRGMIVAFAAIDRVERDMLGRFRVHLRGHTDVLTVSRAYAGLFKQM